MREATGLPKSTPTSGVWYLVVLAGGEFSTKIEPDKLRCRRMLYSPPHARIRNPRAFPPGRRVDDSRSQPYRRNLPLAGVLLSATRRVLEPGHRLQTPAGRERPLHPVARSDD